MNPTLSRIFRGGLLALASFSGAVSAGFLTDVDPNWEEDEVLMPPPMDAARLRAFYVSATTPNQFFVDEGSVSVGADGVVRFTLVVRTPGGAENVSFEGIRCATGERRLYASGRADGEWVAARNSVWQPIVDNTYNRPRAALAWEYFCDGPAAPRNREHALRLLQQRRDQAQPYGVR
ncbi:MAG TPA: CNP1-like family protein [Thauera sp.]|uniref:CNP1-like family protein n=1 Tax=Thauera sp. TaxID=1905334 RepID=UPI002B7312DC|nr:CNP1-like family protein [Thauera sp.]HRP23676.1 CNP1-like family protein [Thauera sp.]HRP64862.1 CNP1-like family protein [Thauera sp.]